MALVPVQAQVRLLTVAVVVHGAGAGCKVRDARCKPAGGALAWAAARTTHSAATNVVPQVVG